MATLERAIEIAARAHAGQVQHDGSPYILHPLEVMMQVKSLEAKMAAVLHDVIEDTAVTMEDLRKEGFSEKVLATVDLLTRKEGQDYLDYLKPIRQNAMALEIKLADLNHNIDLRRLPLLSEEDIARMKKYHHAIRYLNGL